MKNKIESIAAKLKKLIEKNGPEYIFNEPFSVFKYLSEVFGTETQINACILCVLVSGVLRESEDRSNPELLSKEIQKQCCFKSKMADMLSEIFSKLYSEENETEWRNKKFCGLKKFLSSDFTCDWVGFAVWRVSGGGVSCHYNASIELSPSDKEIIAKELAPLTDKNPFLTMEEICEYYRKKLIDYLDDVFDDYCTCEPYYEPVVEDFYIKDYTEDWCRKNGIKILSCEGDGFDDGYEPDFIGGWRY